MLTEVFWGFGIENQPNDLIRFLESNTNRFFFNTALLLQAGQVNCWGISKLEYCLGRIVGFHWLILDLVIFFLSLSLQIVLFYIHYSAFTQDK